MKTKLLYFLLLLTPFVLSCNKETEPVILTGDWNINNEYVYTNIRYDLEVSRAHPDALQYLIDNEDQLAEPLKNVKKLTFSGINTIIFHYLDNSTATGTYVIEGNYFFVESDSYPDGLAGYSDNSSLELYYPLEYMTNILNNLLTPSDPSEEIFTQLIQSFVGVATYTKTSN
jgi:hypothetical protein